MPEPKAKSLTISACFLVKFLLKCLYCQGLIRRQKRVLKMRTILILSLVNVYAIYALGLPAHSWRYADRVNMLYLLIEAIKISNVAYLIDATLLNGQLLQISTLIISGFKPTESSKQMTFLKSYYTLYAITSSIVFVSGLTDAYFFDETEIDKYAKKNLYNYFGFQISVPVSRFFIVLDRLIYGYIEKFLAFLFQVTFAVTVEILRTSLARLSKDVENPDSNIHELNTKHSEILSKFRKLNRAAECLLLLWLCEFACTFYYSLVKIYISRHYVSLYSALPMSSLFLLLILMSKFGDCNGGLLKALHLRYATSGRSLNHSLECSILQEKFRAELFRFTLFRSSVINLSFVGGLVVGILSYATFVLSQVNFN